MSRRPHYCNRRHRLTRYLFNRRARVNCYYKVPCMVSPVKLVSKAPTPSENYITRYLAHWRFDPCRTLGQPDIFCHRLTPNAPPGPRASAPSRPFPHRPQTSRGASDPDPSNQGAKAEMYFPKVLRTPAPTPAGMFGPRCADLGSTLTW